MSEVTEIKDAFLLSEAEYLRKVYYDSDKEIGVLERYALVASGAIWSWCAANADSAVFPVLVWLPLLLQILFGLRAWGIYRMMITTRRYLAEVEEKTVGLSKDLGWGRYLSQHGRGLRVATGYLFWAVLHAISILIALVYGIDWG
jgi:hypothetical protein